jgi:hypothetical protein
VNTSTHNRHAILADKPFWLALEYVVCGWIRVSGDDALRGFWCDGFIPHVARNTKSGIEVLGDAWIVDTRGNQHKFSFIAAIPQRMLARRRSGVVVIELTLDLGRKRLEFSVGPAAGASAGQQQGASSG